jgi:serine/threonine protein kinase
MGVVLAAHDPRLGRTVALKLVRSDADPRIRAHLHHEAQAIARVVHPNVVGVYDVDTDGDAVFIAMELVRGPTLQHWLAHQSRTWREVVDVFIQAGQGLAAAHDEGVLHRDFKPANAIVDLGGRVRVLDFGLACPPTASSEQDGFVVGTPAYMAPEQHYGDALTPRTDQYAFCTALWEALFGARPFAGLGSNELAQGKARGRIMAAPRGRAPRRIVAALRRGLHPRPDKRWPDMRALLRALASRPPRLAPLAIAIVLATGELGSLLGHGGGDRRPEILRDEVGRVVRRDVLEAAVDVTDDGLVEDVLGPLHGQRRIGGDLPREGEGRLVQGLLVGQDPAHEPDALRMRGVEVPAGEDQLAGVPGPDHPR